MKKHFTTTVKHTLLSQLLLIWLCSACVGLSYYDNVTYKNLTETKPEVTMLYDSFKKASLDTVQLNGVKLKMAQIYEYEKGKGNANSLTAKQLETLINLFTRNVNDRLQNGPWNPTYANDKIEVITTAFDLAIQTEAQKNKKNN